jgi:hypothetical protein
LVSAKHAALAGVVLASASGFVLLFAGYGGEAATCPDSDAAWIGLVAIGCAVIATLGMAAAMWAYRETAGEPSGDWLLGTAALYVTTLAWTATIAGAVPCSSWMCARSAVQAREREPSPQIVSARRSLRFGPTKAFTGVGNSSLLPKHVRAYPRGDTRHTSPPNRARRRFRALRDGKARFYG